MGLSLRTNVTALNAQRNLNQAQSAVDSSMSKLSSGMRITRAGEQRIATLTAAIRRGMSARRPRETPPVEPLNGLRPAVPKEHASIAFPLGPAHAKVISCVRRGEDQSCGTHESISSQPAEIRDSLTRYTHLFRASSTPIPRTCWGAPAASSVARR